MSQCSSRQIVRKRLSGQICRCSECGRVVWPYPLPISPAMRLARGYPKARAALDRRAQAVRFAPILWCDSCAPLLVVQWWIRWERMADELLETLPSIPAAGVKDLTKADLSADEAHRIGATDASAAGYSRSNQVALS